MKSLISEKVLKKAKFRSRRRWRVLRSLFSAALLLPGLGLATAQAQSVPAETEVRFQYAHYSDYQKGGGRRIAVDAPSVWLKTSLGEATEIETSGVYDSVSGASPLYHSTLSGASGLGISDARQAGDVKLSHSFERFGVSAGLASSTEDDYDSFSASLEGRWWTADKNTTLSFGFSADDDSISSSMNPSLDESRNTQRYFVGLTQVLGPDDIVQSNIAFQHADGYLSDPYKILDNRPRSREAWSWLTRYNHYLSSLDGSLHLDYRLYYDSFAVVSHMLELGIYLPLGENWMLRQSLRYYTQRQAQFYNEAFPPEKLDTAFYSSDQRMGSFGAITAGLKLERAFGDGWSANASFDYLEQRPGAGVFSGGSDNLPRFYGPFYMLGLSKVF